MILKRAELVEVIKVRVVAGDGTKENPVREVIQYWEKSGEKIAEKCNYDEISFAASEKANSEST